jgi:TetR/AcrR family transcriptional regulator, transcriptional repressor for nem operon
MSIPTKARMLNVGLSMLLRHGYNDLSIQAVLKETGMPKGSFYHHFASKEDFALQVVDRYMNEVHQGLDASLGDRSLAPLGRVRKFFEMTRDKYHEDGYLGCMLGGLGQELSGVSPVFQQKIEACLGIIADRIAACMEEAQASGDLPPDADPSHLANLMSIVGRAPHCAAAYAATQRHSTPCSTSASPRWRRHRNRGSTLPPIRICSLEADLVGCSPSLIILEAARCRAALALRTLCDECRRSGSYFFGGRRLQAARRPIQLALSIA